MKYCVMHPASTPTCLHLTVTRLVVISAAAVAVAMLLVQSFAGLLNVEKGFTSEKLVTVDVNLMGPRYASPQLQAALVDAIVNDVEQTPEVATVAVATQLPQQELAPSVRFQSKARQHWQRNGHPQTCAACRPDTSRRCRCR